MDATQYLVKPVIQKELYALLDRIFADVEAQKKSQYLSLTDGAVLCLHMSMAGLEELFVEFSELVRVGKSYIINLKHVESLNGLELQMDNGEKLYVPRGAYQFLREQYFSYYTEGLS